MMDTVRAMPSARAATASRLSPCGASCKHRIAIAALLTITWLPFAVVGAIWWIQDNYTSERAAVWFSGLR